MVTPTEYGSAYKWNSTLNFVVPAVFGTLIGGIGYSPFAAVVFLSLAGGAVFQVILLVLQMLRTQNSGQWPKGFAMPAGIMVGMLVMYLTGLIVG